MERRSHKDSIELRELADQPPVIAGYAAVFDSPSFDMGFIETIDPAAFNRTLNAADVRGLGNHDVNWLLGRAKAGTLRLFVDDRGLGYEVTVNMADPDGVRAVEKVRRGDWDGSSFSFQTIRDQWTWDATPPQRRLLEVALIDVGPVTYPAYPDATANARDLQGALEPIAKTCGHPVDVLVAAMQRGEIRSLITSETRGASGSTTWPLHSDRSRAWSASDADSRLRAWAGGDSIDWTKYASVHFWVDPDMRQQFGGYKLPFCDVVDDKVQAIWRGVSACAAAIQGSRGGVSIPSGDVPAVKRKIEAYYTKAAKQFDDDTISPPWQGSNSLRPRGERRQAGDLVWGPEDGFCDLLDDCNDALNATGGYQYVAVDITLDLTRLLVYALDGDYYVAPISVDAAGNPTVAQPDVWIAVDEGWVAVAPELGDRALGRLVEHRAGKRISAASREAIESAIAALTALLNDGADGSSDDGDSGDSGNAGRAYRELLALRERELAVLEHSA
jgi:HK97 family phage prohead protease